MPVVCCSAPPAAIRQEKRSMRADYGRSSEGDGRRTSKADKAAARKTYLKSVKVKKVVSGLTETKTVVQQNLL